MSDTSFKFEAIGTHWQIDIFDNLNLEQQNSLLAEIRQRISVFNETYSRFATNSLVTKMSTQAGEYILPADAKLLLDLYFDLYRLTQGAFTPIMGSLLVEAGYDKEYSLLPKELHKLPILEDVVDYNFPKLNLKKPVAFDFGAAGKGYLIDIISNIIKNNGIKNFCVDAGGDIFYQNSASKKLRVGLEHPHDTTKAIGVVELLNNSVCGSAGNRRAWKNFHHIIDPRTLASPQDIIATWVVAETTLLADALATCLFFVPGKNLQEKYQFEYMILFQDFSAETSTSFPGEIFTS